MPRTAIVGASGYTGGELVGLLLRHRGAEVVGLFGSAASERARPLAELHPRLRSGEAWAIEPASVAAILATRPEAVLLATPHAASLDLAPQLLDAGVVVFDLSGAFRLPDPADYPRHYGFEHRHADLLARAAYGLAELNADAIAASDLIAVPGCYPTSVILPLRPLADADLLDPSWPVIVDAVSGVSGAGRSPSARTSFCEVSLQPYGVLAHRHTPEIAAHGGAEVIFTPHLGPFPRGILSTIHLPLRRGTTDAVLRETIEAAYADAPFVRLLPAGEWPSIAAVERTNHCDIAMAVHPDRPHAVVASAIDNLLKGAAGQAVQCLNIRFGLPATEGLPGSAIDPSAETWERECSTA
jgi:N-acetyl-gamma-glutamyl-phosphate reductase